MLTLLFCALLLATGPGRVESSCSLEPPLQTGEADIGLIFVPGAQISGDAYLPLLRKIQENFPANLWIGATTEWLGEMPNPIQIGSQINACLGLADEAGYSTENVFFGGHSLGGIVLESYISGHAELAKGVILLGTWLPDLVRADNEFPVPVLTAIGELDGGGLSYLVREWQETEDLAEEKRLLTKTIFVPQVNHGQVASGEVPESVVDNDIDGEISEEEAHSNYGTRVADWLVINCEGLVEDGDLAASLERFSGYSLDTETFLHPFLSLQEVEQIDGSSPYVTMTQVLLLEVAVDDNLAVKDEIVNSVAQFQARSPTIFNNQQDGMVEVGTLSHLTYDLDVLDFNNHLSVRTIKSKMKSADAIYSELQLPPLNSFLPCSKMNQAALDLALSLASPNALQRLEARGRKLSMTDDEEASWGVVPWEFSELEWREVTEGQVQLTSTRLVSDVDFPLYPGMHYCDLLSPYRALEWVYIESLRHVMQF